ncbi:MAG: RimK family protein [Thalassolituus sp.]|jgi:glutathione synthase/RimK-type ligase-like ATP-grasp enzyme|uniref:RimK family protein n=1 Tax=Thalassolituus TaxID=187492 RepID=UPI001B758C25|nr:RimK family protein [Thalassolituus oleivorans]MBQ0726329.1 RimK family protein [Thalassolituus oleivorans]
MKPLLVLLDQLTDWSPYYPTNQVVAIEQYLSDFAETRGYVINLCRDYSYLSSGYYGSLLAEARGGQVFPSVRAIRELNSFEAGQPLPLRHGRVLDGVWKKQKNEDSINLRCYFGQTENNELAGVARRIFDTFGFPVLDVTLTRHQAGVWTISNIQARSLDELDEAAETQFAAALDAFSHKIWRNRRSSKRYKYDLAILVNPDEQLPPSNKGALKAFEKAGKDIGLNVDFITHKDASRIGEYDALFIRETTRVDHHTYQIAQHAENLGLLVIDSPTDIMRCSNKVYLHERLHRYEVDTPKTRLIMGKLDNDLDELIADLGLPIIVKVPDGSFSIGVEKAKTRADLVECIDRLSERSALLLLQEFMPTDYDWRIGIMDNQVIYACRYFMAKSHWQIYNHSARSHRSGNADAMAVDKVPKKVIKTALKAAKCMGNGFYGVDLKESGDRAVIIEVNDNPSIDMGVEDLHSGNLLYQQIMGTMLKQLDELNGRR